MNAIIVCVCFKLHNYCIRMSNIIYNNPTNDPTEYGIEPYISGTNDTYEFGFLPTNYDDDTFLFFLLTLTQVVGILLLRTLHQGSCKGPNII